MIDWIEVERKADKFIRVVRRMKERSEDSLFVNQAWKELKEEMER